MQSKQAGGIVSFIIVAVALAGLLAGGLYLSKQQGRTARDNDTSAPEVSVTETKEEPAEEGASDAAGEATQQQAPQANQEATQNSSQPTQNTPSNRGDSAAGAATGRTDRVATTGPSTVPSTGPTETAVVSVGLAALVFTGYRFALSRRALRASALRQ